mmetsp:Transcript_3102/g.4779  ORF Transcript_3102/g.4779 Transcript_3102/m.4779 type:complete len:81 (+) Transcript_3102:231-473(+)
MRRKNGQWSGKLMKRKSAKLKYQLIDEVNWFGYTFWLVIRHLSSFVDTMSTHCARLQYPPKQFSFGLAKAKRVLYFIYVK